MASRWNVHCHQIEWVILSATAGVENAAPNSATFEMAILVVRSCTKKRMTHESIHQGQCHTLKNTQAQTKLVLLEPLAPAHAQLAIIKIVPSKNRWRLPQTGRRSPMSRRDGSR